MKETQIRTKDEIKLHAEKQIEKQTVLVGSGMLRPGHRCFEINTLTLEAKEADYEKDANYFNAPEKRTIKIKPDCVYINAMNKANALKVHKKGGRVEVKPFMSFNDIGFI